MAEKTSLWILNLFRQFQKCKVFIFVRDTYLLYAAKRKNILALILFCGALLLYSTEQIYAQEVRNIKTLHAQEGKRTSASKSSVGIPFSALPRNERKISEICLRPADLPEQIPRQKFLSFKDWLTSFAKKAVQKGVSPDTVHDAFKNVSLRKKVIRFDRKQKEYSLSFTNYINNSISPARIQSGKRKIRENAEILHRIEKKYAVPSEILVSLWGLESNFGSFTGNFSTVKTLATLAYEGRRRDFFSNELLCALAILDSGHIAVQEMKGSWAGAMGQPQFMPSTFLYYAADGNGDGEKDIWKNTSDVLTSAANYLYKSGWEKGRKWGLEVVLPETFDPYQATLSVEKSVADWRSLGVKKPGGRELRETSLKGSIILPAGLSGPAFLVFHNFRVIREWNKSMNYALTVGHLADRIAGAAPLVGLDRQRDKNLSRQDAVMIQEVLSSLGYYKDKIDGMIGMKSRAAIREYQKEKGIPADGYPSDDLIRQLRREPVIHK